MAVTAIANRFTTAIVVRYQIILAINRIVAGTNPVDGRWLAARRTASLGTAATRTKRAADGAIPPVIATFRITQFIQIIGTERTRDGQQRQRAHTDHGCA